MEKNTGGKGSRSEGLPQAGAYPVDFSMENLTTLRKYKKKFDLKCQKKALKADVVKACVDHFYNLKPGPDRQVAEEFLKKMRAEGSAAVDNEMVPSFITFEELLAQVKEELDSAH